MKAPGTRWRVSTHLSGLPLIGQSLREGHGGNYDKLPLGHRER